MSEKPNENSVMPGSAEEKALFEKEMAFTKREAAIRAAARSAHAKEELRREEFLGDPDYSKVEARSRAHYLNSYGLTPTGRPHTMLRDIGEFHRHFDLMYIGKPRALPGDMARFRSQFLREEADEYDQHSKSLQLMGEQELAADQVDVAYHLEEMLDALVDSVYVALGTAYLHGFDFQTAWDRVHAANMKKVRATDASQSKRGSTFDVVKPPGWVAPSHTDLVEDHAHRS